MSGHSKWATTKHKKAVVDAKRSKLFAKLIKNIEVAARTGGGDPAGNPTLATRSPRPRASVPNDNIDRAVKRGSGRRAGDGADYEDDHLRGLRPDGVAILVECLTDNRNRAASEVRVAITRNGGRVADPGSVAYLFARKGIVVVDKKNGFGEDDVLAAVLDAGAEEVNDLGDAFEVVTEATDLHATRTAVTDAGLPLQSADYRLDADRVRSGRGGERPQGAAHRRRPRGPRRRPERLADKAQVGVDGRPAPQAPDRAPKPADAADALALAICHIWRGPRLARLRGRRANVPPAHHVGPGHRSEERVVIANVTGVVSAVGATWAVVTVGGMGLRLLCTPSTCAGLRPGQEATLATSLVVREDSLTLYGFADDSGREMFELVQTATGVGPKLALAIVSVLSADAFRTAIATENLATLSSVPGIGRRGAQRLVIELKDKVAGLASSDSPTPRVPVAPLWREQVRLGLEGLGWSTRDAEAACERVQPLADEDPSLGVAALMRAALRTLAK
jgi:Holliday junction DNA helicase RuvA subunit